MKKNLKFLSLLIIPILISILFVGNYAKADSTASFFKKVGNYIEFISDSFTLKVDNAEFDNVTIGGVVSGDLDLDGNSILDVKTISSSETKLSPTVVPRGTNILTDGGLETWTDANTLTDWIFASPEGQPVRSEISHSGTYSAELTATNGTPAMISQLFSGLTVGETYNVVYWARYNVAGDSQILVFNDGVSTATQIFRFSDLTWQTFTGAEFSDPDYSSRYESLTDTYAEITSDSFTVPANGQIFIAIGDGGGTDSIYLDDVDLATPAGTTPSALVDLWSYENPSDRSLMTSDDNLAVWSYTGGTAEDAVQWTGNGSYAFTSRNGAEMSMALVNKTLSNADEARSSSVDFIGFKADGTEVPAGAIRVQHDGTGDDFKTKMNLKVNTGALSDPTDVLTVTSDKYVGVGTNDPIVPLHIKKGTGTAYTPLAETVVVYQSNETTSTNSRFGYMAGTSGEAIIDFGDVDDQDAGGIKYNNTSNYFSVRTNGVSDRMIIDSSGNVGIGTTPSASLHVIGNAKIAGTISAEVTNGTAIDMGFVTKFDYRSTYGQMSFGLRDLVGRSLVINDYSVASKDFDHASQINPTLFVHSVTDPDTANDEWVSITHDQTNAVFGLGSGAYTFPDGDLGIGTSTFTYGEKLAVNGAISAQDFIGYTAGVGDATSIGLAEDADNRAFIEYKQGEHYLKFGTVNATTEYETMFLVDGKVGIGTDSPEMKLDVQSTSGTTGDSAIKGKITSNGGLGDFEYLTGFTSRLNGNAGDSANSALVGYEADLENAGASGNTVAYTVRGDWNTAMQGQNQDLQFETMDMGGGAGYDIIFNPDQNSIFESGSVGIGNMTPDASAILDIASTTQGMLPPRMTTVERDLIGTPATGLFVYNTSQNSLNWYDGSAWETASKVAYGEFKISENTTATEIRDTAQYQAITSNVVTGLVEGFTYDSGLLGVIASVADAGSGDITITDVSHGLTAGDYISINGTTNYDGLFEVKATPTADTFTVTSAFVATNTGYWQKGASITVNAGGDGTYSGSWSSSGIAQTNGHVFDFCPVINTTVATSACARRSFSNADYGSFGGNELVELTEGDVVWFTARNNTASGNVTIRTLDLNLTRL